MNEKSLNEMSLLELLLFRMEKIGNQEKFINVINTEEVENSIYKIEEIIKNQCRLYNSIMQIEEVEFKSIQDWVCSSICIADYSDENPPFAQDKKNAVDRIYKKFDNYSFYQNLREKAKECSGEETLPSETILNTTFTVNESNKYTAVKTKSPFFSYWIFNNYRVTVKDENRKKNMEIPSLKTKDIDQYIDKYIEQRYELYEHIDWIFRRNEDDEKTGGTYKALNAFQNKALLYYLSEQKLHENFFGMFNFRKFLHWQLSQLGKDYEDGATMLFCVYRPIFLFPTKEIFEEVYKIEKKLYEIQDQFIPIVYADEKIAPREQYAILDFFCVFFSLIYDVEKQEILGRKTKYDDSKVGSFLEKPPSEKKDTNYSDYMKKIDVLLECADGNMDNGRWIDLTETEAFSLSQFFEKRCAKSIYEMIRWDLSKQTDKK